MPLLFGSLSYLGHLNKDLLNIYNNKQIFNPLRMKILGAHLSIRKGLENLENEMEENGCTCCAVFLKNQKRYVSRPMEKKTIELFKKNIKNRHLVVPHGSYLINLANPELEEKVLPCFYDDLGRCRDLGIKYYNFHPGSDTKHLGEKSIENVGRWINSGLRKVSGVVILIETMAGQGNVIGRTFQELKKIIDLVEDKERVGITLDTCHIFAAGYDIRTKEGFRNVMEEFDRVIGLKYLKAVHLNDSKRKLGSRRDLHEHIGKGEIGEEAFRYIMNSKYFEDIPMILETPDSSKYKEEIEYLRSLVENES